MLRASAVLWGITLLLMGHSSIHAQSAAKVACYAVNLIQPVKSNKTQISQIIAEIENVFALRNLRS